VSRENYDDDLNHLVYAMTYKMQHKILSKTVFSLIKRLVSEKLDVTHTLDIEIPKMVFCVFNKECPKKRVNIYLEN